MEPGFLPSDERKIFQQIVGHFGGPAFIRRARDVQSAYENLVDSCRRQRAEWLAIVRLRLGTLFALAGTWEAIDSLLDDRSQVDFLKDLHAELRPELRLPVPATGNKRVLRRALTELNEAIGFFNKRWLGYVPQVNLEKLNLLRDQYNRFYLMEKEAALGSVRVARQGFRKLDPLTHDQLLCLFPPLSFRLNEPEA